MGTNRKNQKAPRTRPKKKPLERRRRERVQKARLVALGMGENEVSSMNAKQVRELLKRPAAVASASAGEKS